MRGNYSNSIACHSATNSKGIIEMLISQKIVLALYNSFYENIKQFVLFSIFLFLRSVLIEMKPVEQYYYGVNFAFFCFIIYLLILIFRSFVVEMRKK